MKKTLKYVILLVIIAIAVSCEKEITIDLPDPEEKIVVEGWIENGEPASVILSKNSPYFSAVDSTALTKLLVTNAKVTVSDGVSSEVLTLEFNANYFPPLIYKGSVLKGEIGKTYFLKVEVEGKTLTSQTTILNPVGYDSLWFKAEASKGDTLGLMWAQFSDPPNDINYYRIFTKRLGRDVKYIPVLGSVYEDRFFNGSTLVFSMFRGIVSFSDESEFEGDNGLEFGYFKKGDTIVVKNGSIDQIHYNFWRSVENEMFSGGNPFSSPAQIPTNIKGGLGIWGGYGVVYDTIVAE